MEVVFTTFVWFIASDAATPLYWSPPRGGGKSLFGSWVICVRARYSISFLEMSRLMCSYWSKEMLWCRFLSWSSLFTAQIPLKKRATAVNVRHWDNTLSCNIPWLLYLFFVNYFKRSRIKEMCRLGSRIDTSMQVWFDCRNWSSCCCCARAITGRTLIASSLLVLYPIRDIVFMTQRCSKSLVVL